MVLVDAVYSCAPDRLGRNHPDALEVPESLLDGAAAVVVDEGMYAPPGERCVAVRRGGVALKSGKAE